MVWDCDEHHGWLGCDCLNFEIWESRNGVVLFLFVWDLDSG